MPRIKYQLKKRFTRLISKHYRGFGIHSPYTFHLVRNVIEAKTHYYPFHQLDRQCKKLLSLLKGKFNQESLCEDECLWIKSEYTHLKESTRRHRLLFRLLNFTNPKKVAFIGDDSGMNLTFLAKVDSRRKVHSLGSRLFARNLSGSLLRDYGISNVSFSTFKDDENQNFDFVQISRTVNDDVLIEFENNLDRYLNTECFLIVEDISKQEGKRLLWERLKKLERFSVSLDLFDVGILFSRKGMKKQDHNLSARSYK